ncbi:MAG: hypothetical protein NVSMB65_18490 [Chloroflexota bacterium]
MNTRDDPPRLPLRIRSDMGLASYIALHPHEPGYGAAYALAVAAHRCFGIPLPYAGEGMGDPGEQAASRGTVLVVDDNADIADVIRATLEDEGYRVMTAVGAGAVGAARDHHPDLILMDLVMPGMDGLEASRRLHEDPATSTIPVIAMTGLPLLQRAVGLPVVDHLPKPFTVDALVDIVAKWIGTVRKTE